jgi:hypothetical protein
LLHHKIQEKTIIKKGEKKKPPLGKYNWMVSLGATFDFVAIFLLDGVPWCNLSQLV